jgi:beta-lactamase class A
VNRGAFIGSALAAAVPIPAGAADLRSEVVSAAEYSTGVVGAYARSLGHSGSFSYKADERFPSASVIKVLIMTCVFEAYDRDPELLAHKVKLELSDFVGGSDILQNYNPGDLVSVSLLVHAMIEQSDNTASNALITMLGFERIAATARRAGLHRTQLKRHFMDFAAIVHHSNNLTTAHDMGSLLYQIERGAHEGVPTVASPASCRKMIDIMLHQEDRDKIVRGLPRGVPVANKTGEIDGVRNDVAIVDPYGEAPYVLAVLTKDLNDFSNGVIAIRRIAKAVDVAFRTG